MQKEVRVFRDYLKSRGLRFTGQRRAVADRVFSVHTHFTVEGLYETLRSTHPISRATIYRTLGLLVESGLVAEYDFGRGSGYYEHVLGHKAHNHFICTVCGKIEEFGDRDIQKIVERIARRRSFDPEKHTLYVYGICRSCQRKRETGASQLTPRTSSR
jgi:Fur family ferric uptake transcriptional regulator